MVANTEGGSGSSQNGGSSGPNGSSTQFSISAPTCASHPCKDKELSQTIGTLAGADLMFDLQRNNDITQTVPPNPINPKNLRPYIAWQWSATAGTTPDLIGLDAANNQYPSYDIDGRLKSVTIYGISQDSSGDPIVTYEDYQGGDIDSTWDLNTCGPKPGLQSGSEIFTFTNNGTYMQVKEGKMYNPETGQFVRSANQRDSIDLIQRTIQLSNNTGRFCSMSSPTVPCGTAGDADLGVTCVSPNPVEKCVDGTTDNCFNGSNIAMTCYDTSQNTIYVRSRLANKGGHFWQTNASGQLQVQ